MYLKQFLTDVVIREHNLSFHQKGSQQHYPQRPLCDGQDNKSANFVEISLSQCPVTEIPPFSLSLQQKSVLDS